MISKNQIKLTRSLHQKKNRDAHRLFLAEGIKTVLELIDNRPDLIEELFVTPGFISEAGDKLNSMQYYDEVTETELEKISSLSTPNKVLAVCAYLEEPDPLYDFTGSFSLYLDDIRDPGNFGTIVRLADWYGISTIFCSPGSCELYNPKVIQATMGAFLRVKVVYAPLSTVIAENKPPQVYGAVLKGKNIYEEKLMNGLIVIGNEANGISNDNMELVTQALTIPSHPHSRAESLNAGIATGIIASEFFRQLNAGK